MAMAYKPISTKAFVEAAIDRNNRKQAMIDETKVAERSALDRRFQESELFFQLGNRANYNLNRYTTFSESVSHSLLSECIYYIFEHAMNPEILARPNVTGIMRAIVSEFTKDDCYEIYKNMRRGSVTLSEMYNLITETKSEIMSKCDKTDPTTLVIDPAVQDNFFNTLEGMDTESITDAIRERVTNAMGEFLTKNAEDHDKIVAALEKTKEKVDSIPEEKSDVRESYEHLSKQVIGKIRSRDRGVLDAMVTAMSEGVMKKPELHDEFMHENKLDMDKIVERCEIMYTFMESVNTMRLIKIDDQYIKDTIDSLKA